jgi:hypothetical protein
LCVRKLGFLITFHRIMSLKMLTEEEIRTLESREPAYMAMSMFLRTSSGTEEGTMESLASQEELDKLQAEDGRFKQLCEMLLDPVDPAKKLGLSQGTLAKDLDTSSKRRLAIEMDRARFWKGLYQYNSMMRS